MAWFTLEELSGDTTEREVWLERIAGDEVSSYVDAWGRRLVWQEEPSLASNGPPAALQTELTALRREVKRLGAELNALRPPTLAVVLTEPPAPAPSDDDGDRILSLVAARWAGSDRDLERQAGLPKAFLAKAKKGRRSGPRSAASWARLECFLERLAA